jgi:hypothetical protein
MAVLSATAFAALPWAFEAAEAPSTVLDPSYQVVLGQAASRGFVAGRDLVFTYGPLAWLVFSIHDPVTYEGFVVGSVVLAGIVTCLFMALARRSTWPPWLAVAVFMPLVLVLSTPERRIHCLAVLLVAYLYDERAPRSAWLVGATTVVIGVLGLAKFTIFVLGFGLYGLLAVSDLARGRLGGILWLLVLEAIWPLAWLATYGSLAGFVDFISTSIEVSRGVNAGMQWPGPPIEVVLALGLALPSLALAAISGRREWMPMLSRLASLGLVWALVFKHAFVRHDIHALMAWSALVAVNVVFLVAGTDVRALRRRGRGMLVARLGLVVASVIGLAWWSELPNRQPLDVDVALAVRSLPESAQRAGRFLIGEEQTSLRTTWDAAMAGIRAQSPLPPITGTVDFYGNDQALAIAHDVAWRPRPVFQSYLATTERLLALNADHLARRGADTLLFAMPPIDGRLPATIEGPSWPVLLSRYVVGEQSADALTLQRREPPGRVERAPLATIETRIGWGFVPVPEVPAGSLVWARITIPPSKRGRLIRTLWKAPIVYIHPELPGYPPQSFALVPEIAAAGFVLSPWVGNVADFATLANALGDGPIRLPAMTNFRIETESPAQFGPITIVFERMTITPPGVLARTRHARSGYRRSAPRRASCRRRSRRAPRGRRCRA